MQRLIDMETGTKALVRRLEGGRGLVGRLASLGFTPGASITLIRKSDHGPLLVMVRGAQVALGHEEADRIIISLDQEKKATSSIGSLHKEPVIALAGQPNVGKSTLFNLLTGLNQHVGNWAGKTIEQKTGYFSYAGESFILVDLPGTYSLTASSDEEKIARDYIIKSKPDVVVALVDAATLERSLYLLSELLLLPAPVILALNMMDVAQQEGIQIESRVLETALGIPVVPMTASRNQGVLELLETITDLINDKTGYAPNRPSILPAHREILAKLQTIIKGNVPDPYPEGWAALKLLEGDEELIHAMKERMAPVEWEKIGNLLYQHEDAILDIAGARYEWITRMIRAAVVNPLVSNVGLTKRLDSVFTHPQWGGVVLFCVLGVAFWLTYSLGSPLQGYLADMIFNISETIRRQMLGYAPVLVEFISGGLLGGLGMVLTFLPILAIFYVILGFLEDTGYLARAAYLTDRWMHMMGLHGKSFLPILLGFGCNVPAVLGTRIIESRPARLLTIMLVPFIPCTARLAVVAVLAPLFFGENAFWVTWLLVGGNVVLLALLGFIIHHLVFENEHVAFIMELPLYHLPNWKSIGIYVWQNILGFLQKAGTTILAAALVVWGLSYFPDGIVEGSYLASFGRMIEPVGKLMGLSWQVLVALITSFAAKENTIATLGVLYGNIDNLPQVLTPPAGLAMLIFQMLFIPCIGTVAAIRQETRSLKWTVISLAMMTVLAGGLAVAAYQIGTLIYFNG